MKSSTWRTVASPDTRTYGLSNGLRGKVKCGGGALSKRTLMKQELQNNQTISLHPFWKDVPYNCWCRLQPWKKSTDNRTVTAMSLYNKILPGSLQRTGSHSYPANSSSRDTFSSGGMVNTDWDSASFLCFFDTTRLGEEITANQADKRKTSCCWIWFHIWPGPQRQERIVGDNELPSEPINTSQFCSLLWNFRLMTPELVYLGLVPPILLIYKSSSFVLFQLQRTKENIRWQFSHKTTCNVCEFRLMVQNTHILRGRE